MELDPEEAVADNWVSELRGGYRLYEMLPESDLFALERYERSIDEEGEMVEDRTLVQYGLVEVTQAVIPDRETLDDNGLLASEINKIRSAYRDYSIRAIEEALYEREGVEIFGQYALVVDGEEALDGLAEVGNDSEAAREVAVDISRKVYDASDEGGVTGVPYVAKLKFSSPPPWYTRAAELHLEGVLHNRPTVALVQAMTESDDDRFDTQEKIASSLGLTQGTVSRHQSTAAEWRERAAWHAKNG